jgi:hypothetical protein
MSSLFGDGFGGADGDGCELSGSRVERNGDGMMEGKDEQL